MISSLRGRLFTGLTVVIVGMALAAGYFAYRWAFDEAIELQDAILLQVGSLAAKNHLSTTLPSEGNVDGEAQVIIEEIGRRGGAAGQGSSAAAFSGDLSDGLQTIMRGGTRWRILVRTRSDGSRLAVGQSTANRDEIAQDSALRTIVPLGVLIPCLMVLIALVVDRTLRPLSRLAERLDAAQSDHLEKLPTEGIPTELLPFVSSINRLLERIGAMFDTQRRFVADAAHELRTPITALVVQAENLQQAHLSQDGRDRLSSLKTGIRRIGHLLEQLLTLARYDSGPSKDGSQVQIDRVLKEVVADLSLAAQSKSIDLGFARIEPVTVRLEQVALTVLVRNLLDNALKHTPMGGQVDVSLIAENGSMVLSVEDNGPGIPDADLDRIFEPFFRGSRSQGEGSGLGLSIARRIVERSHGSICLENKRAPSSGLRVIVRIPRN